MSWYDEHPNPYHHPEKFDLTLIHTLDERLSYEFNMLLVWEHKDGRLFWAADSGCSCPDPFEDYSTLESLNPITQQTFFEFEKAVTDFDVVAMSDRVEVLKSVYMKVREMKE